MATFKGSSVEFKRFLDPYLRNVVNRITKSHKRSVGSCEHCGTAGELQAAHVFGKDRIEIIESILRRSQLLNLHELEIDLNLFERDFLREHLPVEKAVLVLCNACHRKYDSVSLDTKSAITSSQVADDWLSPSMPTSSDLLPITLDPPRINDFVDQFLKTGTAEIQTHFNDGRVKAQTWNARRFTRDSNLFRNLRSRPKFRQGTWQSLGVTKVHVRVVTR